MGIHDVYMSTPVLGTDVSLRAVGPQANRRRWYALRYLRKCQYPADVREVTEHVGPRVGLGPEATEDALLSHDLPVLADCRAIEYDPDSKLVCLDEDRTPFADRVRRAIASGVLTHLKPPKIKRSQQGVFY